MRALEGWTVGMLDGWRVGMVLLFLSNLPTFQLSAQDSSRISEAQTVLAQLVESYGVSGMEAPVRATVQRLLPSWVRTETDTAGNLWVRTGGGQGDGPVSICLAEWTNV